MTIGVDLGGTNIRAGIRSGDTITGFRQVALRDKESLDSTLQQLKDFIRPLVSKETESIGVAVPSIVDAEQGVVYDVVNIPSWKRVELKALLEAEFNVPIAVENDANCFALGEYRHGKAKGLRNVVGVTLGTGVGSGLILDGKIYRGSNGGAGEVGYLYYRNQDFEFYGGSFFFSEVHGTNALEVYNEALAGKPNALRIWEVYGMHIGNLIKSLVYAYDPDAVVFGGSITNAFDFFEPSLRETIASHFHFLRSMERLRILRSENEHITLLGASSLVNGNR
ncbi:MAG TPA: ROK family protein [Cyclobacteriaceae bacterium]|jgi:glucokinase